MNENVKVKGRIRVYLMWPLLLSPFVICGNLAAWIIDPLSAVAVIPFTLCYILIAVWIYIYRKNWLVGGLVEFSSDYAWVQKQLLKELSLPYAMASEDGRLMWCNEAFQNILDAGGRSAKNLTGLFPGVSRTDFNTDNETVSIHTSVGASQYRMDLKPMFICVTEQEEKESLAGAQKLFAVYLFDETEILQYKQQITDEKMVAGLLYLDNYEEALESVEEVRRSLLTALIDRKINKYISSMNGIVKKMEKDKYFFTIKQQYMERIQEEKISILEEVKSVNIGNEMAVTLSIGIGMNGETYSQNYDFARTAIDMALGRGGDQAVLKDGSRILYYGGKSQQLEKQPA